MLEPQWLVKRRNNCALDPMEGLGALKFLLDPLKVDIIQHRYVGVNYVSLRRHKKKSKEFKLYTRSKMGQYNASFVVTNFMYQDSPQQYLFMALRPEPILWAASQDMLMDAHEELITADLYENPYPGAYRVFREGVLSENHMGLHLTKKHEWRVRHPSNLGL